MKARRKLRQSKSHAVAWVLIILLVAIGFIGSAIPLALLYFLYGRIVTYVSEKFAVLSSMMDFVPVDEVFQILIPVSLVLGVGIGFVGSRFTLKRHLKV